eukprot:1538075-Pyramimonas_sp.AAC.1
MAHKLVFSPSLVLWQSDFDRQAQAEVKKESTPPEPAPPPKDYSLKEGETIRVEVPAARPQS